MQPSRHRHARGRSGRDARAARYPHGVGSRRGPRRHREPTAGLTPPQPVTHAKRAALRPGGTWRPQPGVDDGAPPTDRRPLPSRIRPWAPQPDGLPLRKGQALHHGARRRPLRGHPMRVHHRDDPLDWRHRDDNRKGIPSKRAVQASSASRRGPSPGAIPAQDPMAGRGDIADGLSTAARTRSSLPPRWARSASPARSDGPYAPNKPGYRTGGASAPSARTPRRTDPGSRRSGARQVQLDRRSADRVEIQALIGDFRCLRPATEIEQRLCGMTEQRATVGSATPRRRTSA